MSGNIRAAARVTRRRRNWATVPRPSLSPGRRRATKPLGTPLSIVTPGWSGRWPAPTTSRTQMPRTWSRRHGYGWWRTSGGCDTRSGWADGWRRRPGTSACGWYAAPPGNAPPSSCTRATSLRRRPRPPSRLSSTVQGAPSCWMPSARFPSGAGRYCVCSPPHHHRVMLMCRPRSASRWGASVRHGLAVWTAFAGSLSPEVRRAGATTANRG